MKNTNIFQTVMSFLIIAIVSAFCVFAVLTTSKKITSHLNVDVSGTSLRFQIQGRTSDQDNWSFVSSNTTTGVTKDEWRMSDIEFTTTNTNFFILLKIKNEDPSNKLNVALDGVAFDYQRPARFQRLATAVGISLTNDATIETTGPIERETSMPDNPSETIKTYSYSFNGIPSIETLTITISYNLIKFNSDISNFSQNIKLILSKGEAN